MLKRFLGFVVIGTLLLGFGWLFHSDHLARDRRWPHTLKPDD